MDFIHSKGVTMCLYGRYDGGRRGSSDSELRSTNRDLERQLQRDARYFAKGSLGAVLIILVVTVALIVLL